MKYDISEERTIIFDFDGVILDSEAYKIETFKSLFLGFPKYIKAIDDYNRTHRGISRYEKFEHIYKTILHLKYTQDVEKQLGEKYNRALLKNLKNSSLIPGVAVFLRQQQVPMFIASSSKLEEMDNVMKTKEIKQYFTKVYGQPISKYDAIKDVLKNLKLLPKQVLFIGDAIVDLETAEKAEVNFIARTDQPSKFPEGTKQIRDFTELLL